MVGRGGKERGKRGKKGGRGGRVGPLGTPFRRFVLTRWPGEEAQSRGRWRAEGMGGGSSSLVLWYLTRRENQKVSPCETLRSLML